MQLIFDGAGPKWIPEFAKPDHMAHGLYAAVKDRISGACEFCAGAFGVKEAVVSCGVTLAGEHDGHPSFKKLVSQGIPDHDVLSRCDDGRSTGGPCLPEALRRVFG
ncbi:MAG: hypothetical protein LKG23_09340 [Nitrospira sp.]|nr:hypothetical protein [Nitrospira sp.]